VYFSPIGNLPKAGKIAPRENNLISPKAAMPMARQ
jgi:hypothetical protein